jgi:hypothetical protein
MEDIVNEGKEALSQGQKKADEAKASAAAGDKDAAAAQASEASSLIDKAKALLTDERIDSASAAIQSKTPDNIDTMVQGAADKAKEWNNPS